jgi:pimeloyl-ACP methyl ester carboxylesterase
LQTKRKRTSSRVNGRYRAVGVAGALILALGFVIAHAAEAPARYQGVLGFAPYLINVPPDWNGGLVMFAHGYEGEGSGAGSLRSSPLEAHLTQHGYAWAASGYRAWGYRPDWFLLDLLTLRAHFINRFGQPRWTIIHGQSMGGHIAIASLELYPDVYQGALIECGNIDGVGLIDWLHAYTAAAEYFSGLPLLDTPRPEFSRLAAVTWPELMGTPGYYTERGRRFDSVVEHLSGGDVPLRLEGLLERYVQNLNPRDPGPGRAREFARHADTRHITYDIDPGLGVDAATLNREIPRVVPEPGARSYDANPVFAELTGKIRVPVMSLHETADFRVPFRLEQDYRRRTEKAGTSHLLVQRAVRSPGHCGIENEVSEPAFDDLVAWIETGTVPAGDDVLGDVAQLGLHWTPLRDPRDPLAGHMSGPPQ